MKKLILICFILINTTVFSQNKKLEKILEEGKLLFRLEKASWFGTDNFLSKFVNKKDKARGYLSYQTKDNKVNCIFFSDENNLEILVRYKFDFIPKSEPIEIDTINTKPTEIEKNLIQIRKDALDKIQENKGNFFSFYKNTSLNIIPTIIENKRKVFVLTAPKISGVVLLGNDYILEYNKKNKFKKKKKLHNTIIQLQAKSGKENNPIKATIHTHLITDYITSTDVCTMLLYKPYVEWKTHYVIGKKYVTIFDLEKEELNSMKLKAWKKIQEIQENK